MLGLFNHTRALPSVFNHLITRGFRSDKRIQHMAGLNFPPRIFRPGEENLDRPLDPEKKMWREQISLYRLDKKVIKPPHKRTDPLQGRPQLKGIVLKTVIKKPKKPNSANRKCVLVRLSTGKEATCFVPGIGHNLQEHSNVLVERKRTKDVPGLKLRVIRGVYDCSPVIKKTA